MDQHKQNLYIIDRTYEMEKDAIDMDCTVEEKKKRLLVKYKDLYDLCPILYHAAAECKFCTNPSIKKKVELYSAGKDLTESQNNVIKHISEVESNFVTNNKI